MMYGGEVALKQPRRKIIQNNKSKQTPIHDSNSCLFSFCVFVFLCCAKANPSAILFCIFHVHCFLLLFLFLIIIIFLLFLLFCLFFFIICLFCLYRLFANIMILPLFFLLCLHLLIIAIILSLSAEKTKYGSI